MNPLHNDRNDKYVIVWQCGKYINRATGARKYANPKTQSRTYDTVSYYDEQRSCRIWVMLLIRYKNNW